MKAKREELGGVGGKWNDKWAKADPIAWFI
jgi:hypothetical protein